MVIHSIADWIYYYKQGRLPDISSWKKRVLEMGLRRELVLTMGQGDVFMHALVLMTSFIHFILLVCDIDTHGVAQFVQT